MTYLLPGETLTRDNNTRVEPSGVTLIRPDGTPVYLMPQTADGGGLKELDPVLTFNTTGGYAVPTGTPVDSPIVFGVPNVTVDQSAGTGTGIGIATLLIGGLLALLVLKGMR